MTRKEILSIAAIVIVVLFLSFLATALMPLWLPVVAIKPDITKPVQQKVMQRMTRQMIRGMMTV